jgi:ADP-heptose:LPS heptosyltransferase
MLKPLLGPAYLRFGLPMLGWLETVSFRHGVDLARVLGILPPRREVAEAGPQRFLVVHLTPHLGDTIMMMPMLEALRKAHPAARIECAVESEAAPLLRMMPGVDHVYGLPLGRRPPASPRLGMLRTLKVVRNYWDTMRASQPDVCILPRWGDDLFRSMMLAYLTEAPVRLGFAADEEKAQSYVANHRDLLLTQVVRGGRQVHEPEKYCLLLRATGLIPETSAHKASTEIVQSLELIAGETEWLPLAMRLGLAPSVRFAVIAPGASMAKRVWPLKFWAEVMQFLKDRGCHVVLLAGPQDASLAQELHQASGGWASVVAGETTLAESVALLSHASLFLGNDSGPGHIAGALGLPSVILFTTIEGSDPDGASAPERIRPIGRHVAVCRPAECLPPCKLTCEANEAHCITTISPRAVIGAILAIESEWTCASDKRRAS